MAMIGMVDTANPQEIVKQINMLREQEKRFNTARTEYLKGRAVHQADELAKEITEKAKREAESVRQEAVTLRNEAKALLVEAQKDRDLAKSKLDASIQKEAEITDREASLEFRSAELDRRESEIVIAVNKAEDMEARYSKKLSEVQRVLTGLIND